MKRPVSSVILIALAMACATAAEIGATAKPRVFVADSDSWEIGSTSASTGGAGFSRSGGGARPQTAEIIKTFGQRCPQVVVNNVPSRSDYIVVLDHEGGKSWIRHKNKIAVFFRESGDSVMSQSTLSLGGSVQDACAAIARHWEGNATNDRAVSPQATPVAQAR